jgi:hypothetical protein
VSLFGDRGRRDDGLLEWKVRLFSVAAGIAVVGIYLDERWMTGLALVLLAGGMLLRFVSDRQSSPEGDDDEDHGSADPI